MTVSKPKRVLSVFSLVMINVIAVDSLRTLPISAEYGFSLVFYYILAAIVFFIPIALVSAELATGWPKTGGLYVWVREAFGLRWGFMIIWLQWIYNIVWYPTILVFIVTTVAYLFNPHWADNKAYLLCTSIGFFWIATILNCFGMKISSWLSSFGALVGTLIPMAFIIVLGIVWLCLGKPIQIHLNTHTLFPDFSSIKNFALLAGILFGLVGMEMSATHAEEVRDPQRDYPKALWWSTSLIIFSLIFASLAIAVVVPQKQLSLAGGLMQAFTLFLNDYHMHWLVYVIAVAIIIGGLGGVSAWVIGPTKGLMIASQDGSIPEVFGRVNRHGAPVIVLFMQAILFTCLCSVFLFLPSLNSSYWLLTAMTSQLALLVYVGMFAAAICLRYKHRDTPRAYKIPGGNFFMWLVAGVGLLVSIGVIIIGFVPPSQFDVGGVARYEIMLISGIIIFCILPFILHLIFHKEDQDNVQVCR